MTESHKRRWISGWLFLVLLGLALNACTAGPYAGAIAYQRVIGQTSQILVMDPEAEVKTLISGGVGWFFMPSWSRDGKWVAFYHFDPGTQMTTVYAVDLTWTELEPVLLNDQGTFDLQFGALKWSPDGRAILYHTIDMQGKARIYRIDTTARTASQVFAGEMYDDLSPDWSPDGEQFVFASNRPNKDDPIYDLYLSDASGENLTRLTDNNTLGWIDALPAWSPDGSKIAFFRYNYIPGEDFEGGPQGLWLFDLVASEASLLYEVPVAAEDQPPAWSPNGKYLAFLEPVNDNHVLRVMEIQSGELMEIGEVLGDKRTLTWSPDSRALAFTNLEEDRVTMVIFDLQSGEMSEPLETQPGVSVGDPAWGGN